MENIIIPQEVDKCYIVITCDRKSHGIISVESRGLEYGGEEEILQRVSKILLSPKIDEALENNRQPSLCRCHSSRVS